MHFSCLSIFFSSFTFLIFFYDPFQSNHSVNVPRDYAPLSSQNLSQGPRGPQPTFDWLRCPVVSSVVHGSVKPSMGIPFRSLCDRTNVDITQMYCLFIFKYFLTREKVVITFNPRSKAKKKKKENPDKQAVCFNFFHNYANFFFVCLGEILN